MADACKPNKLLHLINVDLICFGVKTKVEKAHAIKWIIFTIPGNLVWYREDASEEAEKCFSNNDGP